MSGGVVLGAIAFWLAALALNAWLARRSPKGAVARRVPGLAVPAIFGLPLLVPWHVLTRAPTGPPCLRPPPRLGSTRTAALLEPMSSAAPSKPCRSATMTNLRTASASIHSNSFIQFCYH